MKKAFKTVASYSRPQGPLLCLFCNVSDSPLQGGASDSQGSEILGWCSCGASASNLQWECEGPPSSRHIISLWCWLLCSKMSLIPTLPPWRWLTYIFSANFQPCLSWFCQGHFCRVLWTDCRQELWGNLCFDKKYCSQMIISWLLIYWVWWFDLCFDLFIDFMIENTWRF